MELTLTNQLTRSQPAASAAGKKKEAPAAPPARDQAREDRLTISRQAIERLEAQSQMTLEQIRRAAEQQVREEEGAPYGSTELDALSKEMDTMQKCQKIAARIMRGDKVPPEDERYLMEHDPTGFKLAMAARKPKRKPKKWKSVLTDEDKNGPSSRSGAGVELEAGAPEEASGESGGAAEE